MRYQKSLEIEKRIETVLKLIRPGQFSTRGLAKKPCEYLEYVVVHELIHLLEPTHNVRFVALMNRFMPLWQDYQKVLNRLPVRHNELEY